MRIRPRLLVVSLVVAFLVSMAGGYLWAKYVADDGDDGVDAVLTDPTDREAPAGLDEIVPNADVAETALPATVLTDADGAELMSTDLLDGRPLVMNFWFTTCPPCAAELPEFAEVHEEVGDEVRFVGINMFDTVPVMERFAGERGVTYELFRDELAELTDAVGATNFPLTLFVASDGTIVDQTGLLDAEGLRERITDLQSLEEA